MISVVGIVGNILSLIVSLRKHNRRITGSWYIAALAVANLWVVVSAVMQWIMGIFFPDSRHPIACKIAMFTSVVGKQTLLEVMAQNSKYPTNATEILNLFDIWKIST